ncbi:MAG: hypothetical protein HYW90_04645 [Candidatus Sungbacteria bacterium]|nr:hypothetical protein [Candidatus Sungbacteria bacterium]
MQHYKMHWRCCWRSILGKIIWIASLLSFMGGLLALWRGGEFYAVSYMTWYWTALVGGVLAMGVRSKHGWCGCGTCSGMDGTQK